MTSGPETEAGGTLEGGLEYHPLTLDRWGDLETLFGKSGAWGGCWCMWWRLSSAEFEDRRGPENKSRMHDIVEEGRVPGILLYKEGNPVGWCSIAPRDEFGRLNRSPLLKPVDEEPVLSIVCFYVARENRNQGITGKLLEAALAYARKQGGRVVEGYPLDTDRKDYPAPSAWTGFLPTFEKAGFGEVLRRRKTRPIVRYQFGNRSPDSRTSP